MTDSQKPPTTIDETIEKKPIRRKTVTPALREGGTYDAKTGKQTQKPTLQRTDNPKELARRTAAASSPKKEAD